MDDTVSNGPGLALPEDPDELLRDLRAASERIRAIGPIPVRVRMPSTAWARLRASGVEGPIGASVEVVIDNDLPLHGVRFEWSDGSETTLDLRRAADAREET